MTLNGWLQILFFLLAIFLVTPLIGALHGARVHAPAHLAGSGAAAGRAADLPAHRRRRGARDALDRVRRRGAPVQRRLDAGALRDAAAAAACCRSIRRDSARSRRRSAFNTAASFTTNTNWQAYGGETTMSYFTQMAGLAYHNFVSAAVGIAVAIAFIRGIAQKEKDTLGNFWVDMVRASLWVLLPICDRRRAVPRLAGRGAEPQAVRQGGGDRSADRHDDRRRRQAAVDRRARADDRAGAGGVAGDHQAVRHQRRRLLQRQQRAPVREPDAAHELPGDVRHLRDLVGPDLHARAR